MEFNKQTVKALLGVVCGGIAFAAALLHLDVVAGAAGWLLGILSPLLLGCAIAFILNVPMRALERCLFPHAKKANKLRRPLALLLTVAAVSAVLALAGMVIVPGVRDAVTSIAAQVPEAFERLQESAARFQEYLPLLANQIEGLSIDWAGLSQKAVGLVQNWGKGLLISGGGLVSGIVSGVTTFFIGLIFSLYILLQKEKLARQGRQLCYAFLPEAAADQLLNILRLSERTFSSFLSGQCLEAVILGTMFFVSMTLLHFPYALLVGVLIALTALIPIVGAFIGCAVGALLMLVNDPWQALWFIVLFLVLQQIEGNLIYPHVVGSSVGLPSIWVLAAVTVGGSLMGILGMLVFIPLCSVLYALLRQLTVHRLKQPRRKVAGTAQEIRKQFHITGKKAKPRMRLGFFAVLRNIAGYRARGGTIVPSDDSDSSISLIYDRFPLAILRGFIPLQRPVYIELCKLKRRGRRQCDKKIIRHQKRTVGSGFHAFFPLKPMQ